MDLIVDLFRMLFFFLDSIVYPLISLTYELLMDIANTTIFTEEVIDLFASKVYALLGIFMLFKVSFSILTYIVNPDDFTDKTKGFSKMISNIVITLLLLVTTPWIFSQAMEIQRIILNDNILGKIFSVSSVSNVSNLDAGSTMSYETFTAFYHFDMDLEGADVCKGITEGEPANPTDCQNYLGDKYNDYYELFEISYVTKNIDFYMDYDLLNHKNSNDEYVMSYLPLISTVAGAFIFWILLMFCFDIAVRSVKLGFLRMIAPIPIVSRIDPKKGTDVFNKWLKNCTSTYLDLFVRLLAIYFAVFVISQVLDDNLLLLEFVDPVTGETNPVNVFVKIFIIMGALLFAKQLPQLIKDLLGVDLNGKFTMNPFKKMSEVPLLGQAASRGLGAVGSLMAGQGFNAGWKAGGKAVPLMGGDGKTSIAAGFNKYSRFGEDYRKKAEEKEASIRNYNKGQELLKQTLTDKKDDLGNVIGQEVDKEKQYQIYNDSRYADSVRNVDTAKDRKNELQSNYEKLKMQLESQGSSMDAVSRQSLIDKVDKARIDYVKADSDYDKIKKAHQEVRKQNAKLAEIEDLYNSARDQFESTQKVKAYEAAKSSSTTTTTSTSTSTSTSASTSTSTSTSASTSSADSSVQERINAMANVSEAPNTPGLNPEDGHNSEW